MSARVSGRRAWASFAIQNCLICVAAGAISSQLAFSEPTLYMVGTAHLDTQWQWTIKNSIEEAIYNTLTRNFAHINKYPNYVFSFEGAFRYQLAREYYPALYDQLKLHVANNRWAVSGSWVDAVDVNIPSPESLIRHTLYGNGFWKKEFGRTSVDIFMPDCFGFGFALPTIAASKAFPPRSSGGVPGAAPPHRAVDRRRRFLDCRRAAVRPGVRRR